MNRVAVAQELVKVARELISGVWGLRWTEDRGMKQLRKQKDFPTEEARSKFIEKMQRADVNFAVEAYSDPDSGKLTARTVIAGELQDILGILKSAGVSPKDSAGDSDGGWLKFRNENDAKRAENILQKQGVDAHVHTFAQDTVRVDW